ncbi:50S ribosomal protein L15 [Candidatus Daviesbacteria bacterium]|nr:50S ribosomal protein L15 [Candidatus Daviesbacteria bacterium]
MKLHELNKVTTKPRKRIGRGLGSGKGKTGGRGSKGQKARGKIPVGFTGSLPLYRKLPLRRGKGNPKISRKVKVISISALNVFKSKSVVGVEELIKEKIISPKDAKKGVKILGNGEINTALTVKLPVTNSAQKKIESKGGKVNNV